MSRSKLSDRARVSSLLLALVLSASATARGQGSVFTFQGRLTDTGANASGTFDMQFKLFDAAAVGTGMQQGPTVNNPSIQVTAGLFNVQLDFGTAVFNGSPRFLEIGVRPTGNPNPYTLLDPRQPITSAPYSIRSAIAATAD